MYLDQGEEMNLERNLNNYLTMASQVVHQVRVQPSYLAVTPRALSQNDTNSVTDVSLCERP